MTRNTMRQKRVDEFLVSTPRPGRVGQTAPPSLGNLDAFLRRNVVQSPAHQLSKSPPTSRVFHRFSDLPPELRIKIWKITCFFQRNIDIHIIDIFMSEDYEGRPDFIPHTIRTTRPPPAVLHACQESCKEGLKYHTLEFGTTLSKPICTVTTPAKIYVNWAVDRLCVMNPDDLDGYNGWEIPPSRLKEFHSIIVEKGLKYLAINVCDEDEVNDQLDDDEPIQCPWFYQVVPQKGDIQELLLFDDEPWKSWGTVDFNDSIVFKRITKAISRKHWKLLTSSEGFKEHFFSSSDFDDETEERSNSINVVLGKLKH